MIRTSPAPPAPTPSGSWAATYIEFKIRRDAIARYGLTVGDVQEVLEVALGGMPLATTVEGLERYDITLRYDRDFRSNLDALRTRSPSRHPAVPRCRSGSWLTSHRPCPHVHQERKRRAQRVDLCRYQGIDVGTYVRNAKRIVNEAIARGTIRLPEGYSLLWSGQYEYMLRAKQRLLIVVPSPC